MAASPVDPWSQTTRARSIVTLDGYVSRGRAPASSVPRDHAMLQDFAAYLELRLKSQNMPILRRIFADFLNEQENTLVPMMQQGCTIVTLFPMLRTSARRLRQAQFLLAKPKFQLDSRGCVFLYLQYRTATRNMALFKHLFLEFVGQRETALMDFVQRGCQVISVIPFELPQMAPPPRPPPPVQRQESPRTVEMVPIIQQQAEAEAGEKPRGRKRKGALNQPAPPPASSSDLAVPAVVPAEDAVAGLQIVKKKPRGGPGKVVASDDVTISEQQQATPAHKDSKRSPKRRCRSLRIASASVGSEVSQESNLPPVPSSVTVTKRGRKRKTRAVAVATEQAEAEAEPPSLAVASSASKRSKKPETSAGSSLQAAVALAREQAKTEAEPPSHLAVATTPKHGSKGKASAVSPLQAAVAAATAEAEAEPEIEFEVEPEPEALPSEALPAAHAPPKRRPRRKRKAETEEQKATNVGEVKTHKRGKPVMSEETCRSQLELKRKMETFEAQIPWEAVYGNLPVPFDESKYPELARKLGRFWRKHSRAVWERKFWSPMSRKLNLGDFNKRNNRQLMARNAFEKLIISVYKEFGAAFFVQLDSQQPQHPGWWYRGPVVALFALQQIKDENAVWDYVKNEALERFPDCKLPVPLTASNSNAMRARHKRDSESMWMVNHDLAPTILREMAAIKAKLPAREQGEASEASIQQPEREQENGMTLRDALV